MPSYTPKVRNVILYPVSSSQGEPKLHPALCLRIKVLHVIIIKVLRLHEQINCESCNFMNFFLTSIFLHGII